LLLYHHTSIQCGPVSSVTFTWKQCSDIPVLARGQPIAIDGKIHVNSGSTDSNVVLQYSPDSDEWLILPHPNVVDFTLATHKERLLAVGGEYPGTEKATNKILIFSESSSMWIQYCQDMPHAVALPAVIEHGDCLIVAGGLGLEKLWIPDVNLIDITTNTWRSLQPLPLQGCHYHSSRIEDTMYLAGIANKTTLQVHLPTLISGASDVWSLLPDKPFFMSSLVDTNSTLLTVGGCTDHDGDYVTTSLDLYDCKKSKWVKAGDLPKPMNAPSCVVLSGKLFIFNWKSAYIAKLDVTYPN